MVDFFTFWELFWAFLKDFHHCILFENFSILIMVRCTTNGRADLFSNIEVIFCLKSINVYLNLFVLMIPSFLVSCWRLLILCNFKLLSIYLWIFNGCNIILLTFSAWYCSWSLYWTLRSSSNSWISFKAYARFKFSILATFVFISEAVTVLFEINTVFNENYVSFLK